MLTDMLITMTDRGPDSAGIAIYAGAKDGLGKLTIQSADPTKDFKDLDGDLHDAIGQPVTMLIKSTHAVLEVPMDQMEAARSALAHLRPGVKVMSAGDSIEIFKEVGLPKDVAARFDVAKMHGTHGIGHTRMATEIRRDDDGRASVLHRVGPVPCAQRLACRTTTACGAS